MEKVRSEINGDGKEKRGESGREGHKEWAQRREERRTFTYHMHYIFVYT